MYCLCKKFQKKKKIPLFVCMYRMYLYHVRLVIPNEGFGKCLIKKPCFLNCALLWLSVGWVLGLELARPVLESQYCQLLDMTLTMSFIHEVCFYICKICMKNIYYLSCVGVECLAYK